jgi:hypothetical protein
MGFPYEEKSTCHRMKCTICYNYYEGSFIVHEALVYNFNLNKK